MFHHLIRRAEMTDDEQDVAYATIGYLTWEFKRILARATEGLVPDQDEFIRLHLSENFRFWK